ncbi:hypothetical protein [Streptomyces ipomoeae]|uniref:hypothetical protein n=1 Tax=Streptomyces ipomoeae TaxID=103232 RepID=UPI0011471FEE|nr:hypothetical protein [Streptomyces ipomoeae]MDX2937917.1 hypothetical protein [Streptomyces ipomoeae]TQE18296.1 hypothetical protein SipoB123_33420 [Streptomyces ipomoeae]
MVTEVGCLLLLTLVIGFFLANPTYNAWLPAVLAVLTAAIVAVLGAAAHRELVRRTRLRRPRTYRLCPSAAETAEAA